MKVSSSDTARLCRGLAMLLHGGVGLAEGVFLLAQEEQAPSAQLLETIGDQMDKGVSLSEALEDSGIFPAYVSGMLRVGGETGRMEEALEALADYYEERSRTARQIRQALAYPVLVFFLMLAVVAVLLMKVLPVFDRVYASLGSRLTGVAAGLMYLGTLLEAALPVLLAVLVLLAAAALVLRLCPAAGEPLAAFWKRKLGDRGIARKFNNARFAQGLSMGIRSGLPLEEAAALAASLLSDVPGAAQRCEACAKEIKEGVSLEEAMAQGGLLPPARCTLLKLGIRSGSADRVMADIAENAMEDARQALEAAVGRIEPVMVLVSSALVGLILLAVMLPLMDIMSTIG